MNMPMPNNMNPMSMIQMFMGKGGNPQQLVNMVMSKFGGNISQFGMIGNLINMAQQGNMQGVETFARNLYKSKGMDFDKEFSNFMGNFNK